MSAASATVDKPFVSSTRSSSARTIHLHVALSARRTRVGSIDECADRVPRPVTASAAIRGGRAQSPPSWNSRRTPTGRRRTPPKVTSRRSPDQRLNVAMCSRRHDADPFRSFHHDFARPSGTGQSHVPAGLDQASSVQPHLTKCGQLSRSGRPVCGCAGRRLD